MKNVRALEEQEERQATRNRVARSILSEGPRTAAELASSLGLTPAGVRRHLDALLAEGLEASTPRTVTDPQALRAQLAKAVTDGYASTVEELEPGLNAVAAPIRGPGGLVIAAVSVSGPSFRLPEERIPAVAARVIAAATEISYLMGYLAG